MPVAILDCTTDLAVLEPFTAVTLYGYGNTQLQDKRHAICRLCKLLGMPHYLPGCTAPAEKDVRDSPQRWLPPAPGADLAS